MTKTLDELADEIIEDYHEKVEPIQDTVVRFLWLICKILIKLAKQ